MDRRAAIPVSLPRENPTSSYWQLDPDAIADLRSTETLPTEADTVIIGSGITGATVAYHLLGSSNGGIVMLEARQACSGATGRNGGHTKAASYLTFPHHQREHGTETAVQIARLELANIRAVHDFARAHGIECESRPCDTLDVVYDIAQWEAAQTAVAAIQEALPVDDPAAAYTFHSVEEVRDRFFCGSDEIKGEGKLCGGLSYEAGSVNAYKFTIGVLKLCVARGLNLQTHTAATLISRTDAHGDEYKYKIETLRGAIRARRVVVATNGYTAKLLPQFQGVIVPLRGHVTAQRPGSKIPSGGLPATYSFFYPKGFDYMVQRPSETTGFEGDIVIGGRLTSAVREGLYEFGTTDDSAADEDTMRELGNTLPRYFSDKCWGADDPKGRVRMGWSGIMGYGADGFPFVGEMSSRDDGKDLWVCASFQGHGMALCWMSSRALVEMMEGRDDEELRRWFPGVFRISEARFHIRFGGIHGGPSSPGS